MRIDIICQSSRDRGEIREFWGGASFIQTRGIHQGFPGIRFHLDPRDGEKLIEDLRESDIEIREIRTS